MANLIIKPTSGGSLILQDEGGDAALTVGTTGSTTLAGTANNLGTVTAGTITAATFPSGHVIQTVVYTSASQASTAATAWGTTTIISMGVITPLFATSDILLMGTVSVNANANAAYTHTDFYKNASDVTATGNLSGQDNGLAQMNDAGIWQTQTMHWKDTCSENSTSAKTYGFSGRAHSASGTASLGWGTGSVSVLVIQELAA